MTKHIFEKPVEIPDDLKDLYEEHKKKLGNYVEWVPPVDATEDETVALRAMRLPKRDRTNPAKNPDLMPAKEIVEESF